MKHRIHASVAAVVLGLTVMTSVTTAVRADLMDVWIQYLLNYRQKLAEGEAPALIFTPTDSVKSAPKLIKKSSRSTSSIGAAANMGIGASSSAMSLSRAFSAVGDTTSVGIGVSSAVSSSRVFSVVGDSTSVGIGISSAAISVSSSSRVFSSVGDTTSVGIGVSSRASSAVASAKPVTAGPLVVTLQDNVTTVAPGHIAIYRVSVQNTTAQPMDEVVVRGPLSAHLIFVAASGGGYSPNPQMVRWDIGRLVAGERREMIVRAIVRPNVAQGTIIATGMQAQRGMQQPADIHAVNDVNTVAGPQPSVPVLDLTIADGTETVSAGQRVSYHIDVHNFAGAPLSGVTVRGPVPQQLGEIRADNGGAVLPNGVLQWNVGQMNAGEARTFGFEGTVGREAAQGAQVAAVFQVELGGTVLDVARDTNTVRASSVSAYICGNGICEEAEKQLICPPCTPDSPPERCQCQLRCPADCQNGNDDNTEQDELDEEINALFSADPLVRQEAVQTLNARYDATVRERILARIDAVNMSPVRMAMLQVLHRDINRSDVLFAYVRALEHETDVTNMITIMNKISNGITLNPDLRVDEMRQISALLQNITVANGDVTVRSVAGQRKRYIDSLILIRQSGGDGGQSGTGSSGGDGGQNGTGGSNGTTGGTNGGTGGGTCGNAKCDNGETQTTCAQDCGLPPPVCGDGICSSPRENGVNCARDCFVYRYNQCIAPIPHATYPDACKECLVRECTKDAVNGRGLCAESCVIVVDKKDDTDEGSEINCGEKTIFDVVAVTNPASHFYGQCVSPRLAACENKLNTSNEERKNCAADLAAKNHICIQIPINTYNCMQCIAIACQKDYGNPLARNTCESICSNEIAAVASCEKKLESMVKEGTLPRMNSVHQCYMCSFRELCVRSMQPGALSPEILYKGCLKENKCI